MDSILKPPAGLINEYGISWYFYFPSPCDQPTRTFEKRHLDILNSKDRRGLKPPAVLINEYQISWYFFDFPSPCDQPTRTFEKRHEDILNSMDRGLKPPAVLINESVLYMDFPMYFRWGFLMYFQTWSKNTLENSYRKFLSYTFEKRHVDILNSFDKRVPCPY